MVFINFDFENKIKCINCSMSYTEKMMDVS